MGIPYYFSHVVKEHSKIIMKYKDLQCRTNSLFLDSNSIVYDVLRIISKDYNGNNEKFEDNLILGVCNKLDTYINEIKPNNQVYIAFDGVAPVAKLEQQRTRRHKSMLEKKIMNHICGEKKEK